MRQRPSSPIATVLNVNAIDRLREPQHLPDWNRLTTKSPVPPPALYWLVGERGSDVPSGAAFDP